MAQLKSVMGLHKEKPRVSGAIYTDEISGFLATKVFLQGHLSVDGGFVAYGSPRY